MPKTASDFAASGYTEANSLPEPVMVFSETELQIFQQARLARDARFDGRFFVAVTSTGIFCR
ncbi:MAG: hypothetical protein B7Z18_03225, partial [Alishewanella sp. 32-51-5]